jgi:hypothetical protein
MQHAPLQEAPGTAPLIVPRHPAFRAPDPALSESQPSARGNEAIDSTHLMAEAFAARTGKTAPDTEWRVCDPVAPPADFTADGNSLVLVWGDVRGGRNAPHPLDAETMQVRVGGRLIAEVCGGADHGAGTSFCFPATPVGITPR